MSLSSQQTTVDDQTDSSVTRRNHSIRSSFLNAAVCKIGALVLRLVSIPIAVRVLGGELFGVYTTILMAVSLVGAFHIGIGPALTKRLSTAIVNNDRRQERAAFTTAFILNTVITLVIGGIAAGIILLIPIPQLFGERFIPVNDTMERAIMIGLVIIVIEVFATIGEMARDGYLESRINHIWGTGANVVAALALVIGIWFFPSIEFLLISVNGTIALSKLGNLISLIVQRPWLLPKLQLFRQRLVRPLMLDGGLFTITYAISAIVEYNVFVFIIGRFLGPETVGVFNIFVTIHFSVCSLFYMYSGPLWPAMLDAKERNDIDWIRNSIFRGRISAILYGLLCGCGLILVGPWALALWLGETFIQSHNGLDFSRGTLLAFSLYLCLHLWRHINQVSALGIGLVGSVAACLVIESSLMIGLVIKSMEKTGGNEAIFYSMAGAIALMSAWLFPVLIRRHRSLSGNY